MFFARSTLLFALLLLLGGVISANELRIHNAEELIDFLNNVNSGTSYSGTTVYLDSDIDFNSSLSQQFEPIGNPSRRHFQGTFDGQGYTISNLSLNSSSSHIGFFGYSKGATIENVVLDSSCSFVSSCNSSNSDVGSISGVCESCTIDSFVNMASVTYIGSSSISPYIGGIVGRLLGSSIIRNCVNYGSVTKSGISTTESNIGGIAGICGGSGTKSIQNCANYGTITHNGESTYNLRMGGIAGNVLSGTVVIESCMSGGRVVNLKQASEGNYIGSVVGYISSNFDPQTTIIHCFWTSDVGYDDVYGYNETAVTVTDSSLKELNEDTLDELNGYTEKNSTWDKWFMLHLNGGKINNLSKEALIVTQKQFPGPVKKGNSFLNWCVDAGCTEVFDPNATSITNNTELYARYQVNSYTITFVFNNGKENEVRTLNFNESIVYPENLTREGYIFAEWSPRPDTMPAEDITVTAQWIEITPELVEIVFEKKDLKEEEIREIIKEYTQDKFTIEKIETDEGTGETKVIVKFEDRDTAEQFYRRVTESGRMGDTFVRVSFVDESDGNFNSLLCPLLLNYVFI